MGGLVDEDSVHGRRALETSRRVHDITRRHPFALSRARVERDERLAGRDPDPQLEPVLDGEVADGERGTYRALWIVLVRDGRAEERHHRVTDELLDRPAVPFELCADTCVVGTQERLYVLRDRATRPAT